MRLTQRQLRQLIESEVDKTRTPKGPNSRDDGDKELTEEDIAEGRLTEEIDPVYDDLLSMVGQLATNLDDLWQLNSGSPRGEDPKIRRYILMAFKTKDKLEAKIASLKNQKVDSENSAGQQKGHYIGSRWVPED